MKYTLLGGGGTSSGGAVPRATARTTQANRAPQLRWQWSHFGLGDRTGRLCRAVGRTVNKSRTVPLCGTSLPLRPS